MYIPQGKVVFTIGRFDKDGDGASGLRFGWFHPSLNRSEVEQVHKVVAETVTMYPKMAETNYADWKDTFSSHVMPAASPPPVRRDSE